MKDSELLQQSANVSLVLMQHCPGQERQREGGTAHGGLGEGWAAGPRPGAEKEQGRRDVGALAGQRAQHPAGFWMALARDLLGPMGRGTSCPWTCLSLCPCSLLFIVHSALAFGHAYLIVSLLSPTPSCGLNTSLGVAIHFHHLDHISYLPFCSLSCLSQVHRHPPTSGTRPFPGWLFSPDIFFLSLLKCKFLAGKDLSLVHKTGWHEQWFSHMDQWLARGRHPTPMF